ncbi:MAG TPA: MFS transporter [Acidimicrobiales bacterium]
MADHRRTVAIVTTATVAGYLPLFLLGALAVQMQRDLGYGASAHGALVSSFNLTVAAAALPLGPIADRVGWLRSIRGASLVLAGAMVGIALLARGQATVAALLVVGAVANSLVLPSGNIAIVDAVPQERRGFAFGIRQAAVPLAVLLGGAAVPLVAVPVGWRPVYLLGALVPVAVAVAIAGVLRSSSSPSASASSGSSSLPSPPVGTGQPAAGDRQRERRRPPLTLPLLLLFGLSATGALMVNSTNAFLTTTAVAGGMGPGPAGVLLVLGSATALVVRVAVGVLVDRRPDLRGFGVIAAMLAGGALGFLLIATGHRAAIVAGTAIGFGAGTGWPGVLHYVVTNEHPEHAGGVSSLMLTCANIGGFLGPLLFGLIVEHVSFALAWTFLAGAAGCAVVCVLASGRGFAARDRLAGAGAAAHAD